MSRLPLLVLVPLLFSVRPAQAAVDIFLETVPVIQGESTHPGHEGDWEILAFSHGLSNSVTFGTGGGTQVGTPSFQDVAIAKFLDRASVEVLLKTAAGQMLDSVTIYFTRALNTTTDYVYYKVVLENVFFTTINHSGSSGEDKLSENVAMHFSKIRWTYTPVVDGKTGPVITKAWDVAKSEEF